MNRRLEGGEAVGHVDLWGEEWSRLAEGRAGAKVLRQGCTWHVGGGRRNPGKLGSGRDGIRVRQRADCVCLQGHSKDFALTLSEMGSWENFEEGCELI